MRILISGAGSLGRLYTRPLAQAGKAVTILVRGHRYDRMQANGLALIDETTGEGEASNPRVVKFALSPHRERSPPRISSRPSLFLKRILSQLKAFPRR